MTTHEIELQRINQDNERDAERDRLRKECVKLRAHINSVVLTGLTIATQRDAAIAERDRLAEQVMEDNANREAVLKLLERLSIIPDDAPRFEAGMSETFEVLLTQLAHLRKVAPQDDLVPLLEELLALRAARAHIGRVYGCACGLEWKQYGEHRHSPACKEEVLQEFDTAPELDRLEALEKAVIEKLENEA